MKRKIVISCFNYSMVMEDFPSKRRYSVADDMMVSKLKDIVKVNFSRNVSKYCMYMLP